MDSTSRRGPGTYVIIGLIFGFSVAAFMATQEGDLTFLEVIAWVGPEFVGMIITVLVIDQWNEQRAQRELEAQLMRRIRSSVRDVAVAAVEELKHLGYFDPDKDTFKGKDLSRVQWAGVNLRGANLEGADLSRANLEGADLCIANLQGADLSRANLEGADLWVANLQGAVLEGANLQEAILGWTNLEGADLGEANLQGAILWETKFHETTILPDGTHWTPHTDMRHFTDPDHPDFWRSDDPRSPAYRGDGEPDGE